MPVYTLTPHPIIMAIRLKMMIGQVEIGWLINIINHFDMITDQWIIKTRLIIFYFDL